MAFRALLHASLDFIESPGLSAGKLYALDLVTRGSVFFEEMFDGDGIFLTNLNQKVVVGAGERNILASDVEEPDNILLALSVISVGDRIPAETAGEFIDIASRTTDKGVVAGAADQYVVTVAAEEPVIALATFETIRPATAIELVILSATAKMVVAVISMENVSAVGALRHFAPDRLDVPFRSVLQANPFDGTAGACIIGKIAGYCQHVLATGNDDLQINTDTTKLDLRGLQRTSQQDRIGSGSRCIRICVVDGVPAISAGKDIGVRTVPSTQKIIPATTIQAITPHATIERIVTGAPQDRIVE